MLQTATIDKTEPVNLSDLSKKIFVPREDFENWLKKFDWTYHQLARKEFPYPFTDIVEFQLGCICADPVLWTQSFLREPEDPNHKDPYSLWDYQCESLRHKGHTIHKCAAEVGKTREIVPYCLWKAFTTENGSGLIGAPQQTHLEEIIEAMDEQFNWNEDLKSGRSHRRHKNGWKKHPHHAFYFSNGFKIDFRPSGHDGEAYRGLHARTFAIKDEAAKDKNKKQWSEFWRAVKPGCVAKIYSVPDGDRSCEFFKLSARAKNTNNEESEVESFKGALSHIKNIKFKIFQWPKSLMPAPYWSEERKKFFIDQYGGEDAPEYKHNVLGEDGDPEYSVFPWDQFKYCIKDIPEYRCLKILVDSGSNEVIVRGYRCEIEGSINRTATGDCNPINKEVTLIDTVYRKSLFFDSSENSESEFRKLIKNFFISVPGLKRGGADFGFSNDSTEIIIKNIIGKKKRLVARLQLRHVTYDQQCQALDAMDDVYGPLESLSWGTDFGNAGSAVAHDLQGLPQFKHKNYDDRLKGFMFESTTENVDEDNDPIVDAKDGKPAKITLKELATDHMVKDVQRMEVEYPPDNDFALYYPNHTCSYGGKHRIFKKEDDHLIDAERGETLAKILGFEMEDLFASGN